MNPCDHQQLERAIRRELQALPELTAPAAVANRVLAAIERRRRGPWYRRSWETWPVAVRVTSLAAMLMLFGGLCLAGWELSHTETIQLAMQRTGQWFSGLDSFENFLRTLVNAAVLVVKKLGAPFIIACLVSAGLGYALFLALGTVYFRLALSKRQPAHL